MRLIASFNMKLACNIFILLIFFIQYVEAQNKEISGKITDQNGDPLNGVLVSDTSNSIVVKSDKNGYYSIKAGSNCEYLRYTLTLYDTLTVKLSDNSVLDVELTVTSDLGQFLNLSLEELLSVKVVSSTSTSQSIKEAPSIITVITAKQIEERGYQTVGEALNSVAGIYPLYDYLHYNVGIRGVNGGMYAWSRIVKVMINGQSAAFRPSSESFLGEELIPISTIERVEIIRGPASALYGANAFLGVINIITKTSDEEISGQGTIKYGLGENYNNQGGNASIYGKIKNFRYLFSGTYDYKDRSGLAPVNVPGSSRYQNMVSENDIAKPYSFYSLLNYSDEKIGDISFDFNYQNLDSYGEFMDWGVLTHRNHIQLTNYYARLKYEKEIINHLKTNISFAYSYGTEGPNDKLSIDTSSATWISRKVGCEGFDISSSIEYTFKKRNNIKVGIDFTSDLQNLLTHYINQTGSDPQPQQGIEYNDTTFRNTGIFLQAILNPAEILNSSFLEDLVITAGVRYDMHNMYDDVFNYRLAGVYNFNKSIYTKLLYGTSYKAPSAVQLYSNYITVGGVIGNPNLKPEKAQTFEWSLGFQPLKDLSFTTSAFYNIINDKVELILPYGTVSNVSYDNVAKINSAGVELEILHNLKNWMNYANFSYQRSILTKENLTKDEIKLKTELYPDVMVKLGSNLALPKLKLNINIEGEYISPRIASQQNNYIYDPVNFRTNRYELPAYFMINMAISSLNLKFVKDSETRFMVKINNLLNAKAIWPGYKDFDIPFTGTHVTFSLTQKF